MSRMRGICRKIFYTSAFYLLSSVFIGTRITYAAVTDWQKSVSLTPKSTTDFSSENFKQSLRNYTTTGGNYVTLIIPYYQSSLTSSDLKAGWNTPTNQSLTDAIRFAKSLNLKVALKPHPEVTSGGWRGSIDPTNRSTWFATYEGILMNLAAIGKQEGVDEIVIGTELRMVASGTYNTSNTQYWNNMISKIRSTFPGKLSYSAQWSGYGASDALDEKENIQFWDKLDSLGLSAYWNLAATNTSPSVETLKAAWDEIERYTIGPLQQKFGKPIMFTEVGFRSIFNANKDTWDYGKTGSVDLGLQQRLYEALYSYWNGKSYFQGVHWWEWETNPNAGGSTNTNFTPQNKPAQQTMTTWNKLTVPLPGTPSSSTYTIAAVGVPLQPTVNQPTNLTVNVKAATSVSSQLVDIEIYNSSNAKIFQKYYTSQTLTPTGTDFKFGWTPSVAGTYTVKTGIFNNTWSPLYYWNGNVLKITTSSTSTPTASYVSTASSNPAYPSPGQATSLNATVTTATNQSNLVVDMELYNSSGSKVFQKYFTGQSFTANIPKSLTATWNAGTSGTYTVKVGVFTGSWSLLHWNNKAATISVGTSTVASTLSATSPTLSASEVNEGTVPTEGLVNGTNDPTPTPSSEPTPIPTPTPTPKPTPTQTPVPTPTPAPAPKPETKESVDHKIKVLEPDDGSKVSGKLNISALVEGLEIDEYDMYVSVNGADRERMRGVPDDTPHKEKGFDFSGLDVKSGAEITLKFTAKSKKDGSTLAEKTITVVYE